MKIDMSPDAVTARLGMMSVKLMNSNKVKTAKKVRSFKDAASDTRLEPGAVATGSFEWGLEHFALSNVRAFAIYGDG